MLELNESQVAMMKEMAILEPQQIVIRKAPTDLPTKAEEYDKVNKDVDALIAAGFIQDITNAVRQIDVGRKYRVITITVLGQGFFTEGAAGVGRA
jgi:hypothetical protein